jgi:hypothetical protein
MKRLHDENGIGLPDHFRIQGARPMTADINSHRSSGHYGIRCGRLSIQAVRTGGVYMDLAPPLRRKHIPEQTFGHGTAANIARAYKKNTHWHFPSAFLAVGHSAAPLARVHLELQVFLQGFGFTP